MSGCVTMSPPLRGLLILLLLLLHGSAARAQAYERALPETPVITVNWLRPKFTSTFLRLCSRAPRMSPRDG